MAHRLAPQARAELDDIWDYVARASGNAAVADSVVDSIVERFYLLGRYPRLGRARDDLRPGLRSFPAGEYVIIYTTDRGGCSHSARAARPPRHPRPDRALRRQAGESPMPP